MENQKESNAVLVDKQLAMEIVTFLKTMPMDRVEMLVNGLQYARQVYVEQEQEEVSTEELTENKQ